MTTRVLQLGQLELNALVSMAITRGLAVTVKDYDQAHMGQVGTISVIHVGPVIKRDSPVHTWLNNYRLAGPQLTILSIAPCLFPKSRIAGT